MKYLINYADKKYRETQKICSFTGRVLGRFDKVISYGPDDIEEGFYKKNREILDVSRGNGLWLWKPYFIRETLKNIRKGDILFYCDSGAFFLRNVKYLIQSLEDSFDDVWISDIPLIERQYTKRETAVILGCDNSQYLDTNQVQATVIMIRKSDDSVKFIDEWLYFCSNKKALEPECDNDNQYSDYISHREDQSILSLLVKKHNYAIHRDPSHRGRYPKWYLAQNRLYVETKHDDDKYPPIIFLHKCPKFDVISFIKQLRLCIKMNKTTRVL